MNRRDILLNGIDKCSPGLEIGPSHAPIAPKKDGFNVEIIDHATREQLVEKYREHDVEVEKIEEVDFVWKGQSYKELTRKSKYYQWIIASHVIEHVPDIIKFINECEEIMAEDGVLSLAIPDHRYCFDCYRPISTTGKVINAHLYLNQLHTVGDLVDFHLNAVKRNGTLAWDKSNRDKSKYEFIFDTEEAPRYFDKVKASKEYIDCHAWCFTPDSFKLLIHDLNMLGLISFKIKDLFPTQGSEFFVTLVNNLESPDLNRMELLQNLQGFNTSKDNDRQKNHSWLKRFLRN